MDRWFLTSHLEQLLAGRRAHIMPVHPPYGDAACVRGKLCYCSVWDKEQVGKSCMYHGPRRKSTFHDNLGREIIEMIYSIDSCACVLPEFVMKCNMRHNNGRFGVSSAYRIDILVVLSDLRRIAIELDGKSHQDNVHKARDVLKDNLLEQCGIEVCRVGIQCSREPDDNEQCAVWMRALNTVHNCIKSKSRISYAS